MLLEPFFFLFNPFFYFFFLKSFSFPVRLLLYKFKNKRDCTLFLYLSFYFLVVSFYFISVRAGNIAFLTCLQLSLLFFSFYSFSVQSRILSFFFFFYSDIFSFFCFTVSLLYYIKLYIILLYKLYSCASISH